jgi:AraC-type DNA-binding domain-containing proteins
MSHYAHETIFDDSRLRVRFEILDINNAFFPAHWHSHIEIILLISGSMTAYINDHAYELSPSNMLIINPKDIHSTQAHGKVTYLLLQLPYDNLKLILSDIELLHFQEFYSFQPKVNASNDNLKKCLLEMKDYYEVKEDGYQLHFTSLIYEFLYILYKEHTTKLTLQNKTRANRDFQRIEQIIAYVRRNYNKQITLKEAADNLSLSTEYFCRLFKKYTNQTFLEYVNAVRIFHFYNDLSQTNDSITYLLEKNGITNYKVFMRLFKETYGTTPNRIKNQFKTQTGI